MASISFTVNNTESTNQEPDLITTGTAAPTTANTIELRIDLAGSWSEINVHNALEALKRLMRDGRFVNSGKLTTPGQ